VYAPLSPELMLRRDCSPDYTDADLGDPVLEVILQPGVRNPVYCPPRVEMLAARSEADGHPLSGLACVFCTLAHRASPKSRNTFP